MEFLKTWLLNYDKLVDSRFGLINEEKFHFPSSAHKLTSWALKTPNIHIISITIVFSTIYHTHRYERGASYANTCPPASPIYKKIFLIFLENACAPDEEEIFFIGSTKSYFYLA